MSKKVNDKEEAASSEKALRQKAFSEITAEFAGEERSEGIEALRKPSRSRPSRPIHDHPIHTYLSENEHAAIKELATERYGYKGTSPLGRQIVREFLFNMSGGAEAGRGSRIKLSEKGGEEMKRIVGIMAAHEFHQTYPRTNTARAKQVPVKLQKSTKTLLKYYLERMNKCTQTSLLRLLLLEELTRLTDWRIEGDATEANAFIYQPDGKIEE